MPMLNVPKFSLQTSPRALDYGNGLGDVPSLQFATSRGNNALTIGDTWTLKIRGAMPNAEVKVFGGNGTNYPMGTVSMGSSDDQGSFDLSGTIDESHIGQWQETWYVGGQQVGEPFSFTVASVAAGSSGGGSDGTGSSGTGTNPLPTGTQPLPVSSPGMSLSPNLLLIGGGALLLILLLGGRR